MVKFNEMGRELVAGAFGGMAGLTVGYPFDTVKTVQQVDGTRPWMSTKKIWKTHGVRGFYRGLTVPLLTNGLMFAVFFSSYTSALEWNAARDGRLIKSQNVEEVSTYTEIFVGGCWGGLVQSFVASPIELLKVKIQTQGIVKSQTASQVIKNIYSHRGFSGVWIGLGATFWRDIHSHGVYTLCYKYYMDVACPGDSPFTCLFMAGGLAGCLFWWTCLPFDTVKSRIQADSVSKPKFKGFWDCTKTIYKQGGVRYFFKGLLATSIRAFPSNGALFLVHHKIRELLGEEPPKDS